MTDETQAPLTPIEQSRAETGRRYFSGSPQVYLLMANEVNRTRNYPLGIGSRATTLEGLMPIERLEVANDGSGYVLLSLEAARLNEGDDVMLSQPIQAGLIVEMTKDEFMALRPVPVEEEEDEFLPLED